MSYKKQHLLTLHEYLGSHSLFGEICIAHYFSFLCCVFVCLHPVPNVVSVSGLSILDCPFIFSYVYIPYKNKQTKKLIMFTDVANRFKFPNSYNVISILIVYISFKINCLIIFIIFYNKSGAPAATICLDSHSKPSSRP